jgi:hypothetical protein
MKNKNVLKELKHHVPFTALATIIAIIIVLYFRYVALSEFKEVVFHSFHILHIIASAAVTSAIFYKYKKDLNKALLVGVLGAIIIGTMSDVIFPYLGGLILNLNTEFHLPLLEMPVWIVFYALLGSVIGTLTKLTKMPHFLHVFLSVFASLLYLLTFSPAFEFIYFIGAFFTVFIAVIIPCCLSDIIFPFLFLPKK